MISGGQRAGESEEEANGREEGGGKEMGCRVCARETRMKEKETGRKKAIQ